MRSECADTLVRWPSCVIRIAVTAGKRVRYYFVFALIAEDVASEGRGVTA